VVIRIARASCIAALAAVTLHAQNAAPGLTVRIVAPTDDSYVSGPTVVRAQIEPANAAVNMAFYVDGRLVCRASKPPYECNWDAGPAIAEHQVRVVATSASGPAARSVATIATRGVGVAETVDVNLVEVTATVTDGKGKFVTGLPKTAFHVLEDGQPQTIKDFTAENVPLDLVVAVDVSSSMQPSMTTMKSAVKEFVSQISTADRVTLLGFNDTIFPLARRATDPAERMRAVDRLTPWGATALYDVVISGVDLLSRASGRKAMLVFTDGEDEGSHAAIADVERKLLASDVTLYMIGQGRGATMEKLKRVMERLSNATGGRTFETERIEELRTAFAAMLDELSHQYLIGYSPTNSRHDGTLRHLKVEVDGRYQVRARDAYRAAAK
jgi:Ca-activated chloride channel family protein